MSTHHKTRESNVMVLAVAKEKSSSPTTPPPHSVMETRLVTVAEIETWQQPRFQRPIRMNQKVMEFSEDLKRNGGIISGVITLGQLPSDPALYKVDGAHRCEAAKEFGLPEFIVEVRTVQFLTLAEMAQEFVRLNSSLVRMRPDDILRGMEETTPMLKLIWEQCPFVGYDNVRRASSNSAVMSMSALLRCWAGANADTPGQGGSVAATSLSETLDETDVSSLCIFLNTAYAAWGNDPEYYRLWGALNITMCMWLYRLLVLKPAGAKVQRLSLKLPQFNKCLMSLSASGEYVEWLAGRSMSERDRSPCYRRLRAIFVKRLTDEGTSGRTIKFPSPAWYSNK